MTTDQDTAADTHPPLRGLTVLVTGAAEAEGQAIARALGRQGANLHLADGNETALIEATRSYRDEVQGGIKLHAAQLDRAVGVESLVMECDDADVVIHAAGTFPDDGEEDATRHAWEKRVLCALPLLREAADGFEDEGLVLLVLPALPDDTVAPHPAMAHAALDALCRDDTVRADMDDTVLVETVNGEAPDAILARVESWWKDRRATD